MFINSITILPNTDGKTGTTAYNYSDPITGKLLGFSYIPTTQSHYSTGNSVGAYTLVVTHEATGIGQMDCLIKKFPVTVNRQYHHVSIPLRGTSGKVAGTTDLRVPWIPLINSRVRVVVAPATSSMAKNARIDLLIDGPPGLVRAAT